MDIVEMDFERILKRHYFLFISRECVGILDLWVQVHPGELWVSKQRVHIVLEASKSAVMSQRSAGSCTRCTRANAFPANTWPWMTLYNLLGIKYEITIISINWGLI